MKKIILAVVGMNMKINNNVNILNYFNCDFYK